MGDRFFDLANFSINHELDDDASATLLGAYFGGVRDQDVQALALMRFMSDFREAMWGVVQSAVSELDFDFDAYASEHFERLRRTTESGAFRGASPERCEGRPEAPFASDCRRRLGGLGRQRELAELLLLELLSSSSVPMRTGPLNQLFAESTHQPPKSSSAPPTRIGA